jgi:peptidoglycan-associated lipoprotein
MKPLAKIVVVVLAIAFLAGCASRGVSSADSSDLDYQDTYGDDTRDADSYAYDRDAPPSGQPLMGGPNAITAERVVYFDFDSADIRSESRPVIEANARYLANNPNATVILEGHTDEQGTREYNIGLGERRGESVRRLMSAYGVDLHQLRVVSYGEERPAVAGQDETSYTQNRRVEITYN